MRLTEKQKRAAIDNRPGSALVRVGDRWAAWWKEPGADVGARWQGQVLSSVKFEDIEETVASVWWVGITAMARTRRELMVKLEEIARS